MPIYGYTCEDCQHHFEIIRPVSQADSTPPECEHCHSQNTTRKLGNVMAIFESGGSRTVVGGSACGSCSSKSASACASCNTTR